MHVLLQAAAESTNATVSSPDMENPAAPSIDDINATLVRRFQSSASLWKCCKGSFDELLEQ